MKQILLLFLVFTLVPVFVLASDNDITEYKKVVIDKENVWTDSVYVQVNQSIDVSIYNCSATNGMTIVLQRKFPEEAEWKHEVESWTLSNQDEDIENITKPAAEFCYYRIGCPTGGFSSGSCTVRIGRCKSRYVTPPQQ